MNAVLTMTPDGVGISERLHLASLVRLGGQLVLVDHESDVDRTWSYYQRTRALHRYKELLEPLGLRVDRFVPYGFRAAPTGFLVLERVA